MISNAFQNLDSASPAWRHRDSKTTFRSQFHQRSTSSFCVRRFWRRKKRQSSQHCHFTLLGSTIVKVVRRMLMKSIPGLNFTNVLWAAFAHVDPKSAKKTLMSSLIVFCAVRICSCKKLHVEFWWNWLQVSISSTFYERIFCTKFLTKPERT